jgi:RNA polymerase sigma-70 factor (ECF subfamily)
MVNGVPGAVCTQDGALYAVMAFTVRGHRIIEIDILSDPARVAQLGIEAP